MRLVIQGEPCSKANSRKIVTINGMTRIIKSAKARAYAASAPLQMGAAGAMLTGRLRLTATLYYATERPDLDASVLLDALQGHAYANDRQIRELHLFHAIDRAAPRAEVLIEQLL